MNATVTQTPEVSAGRLIPASKWHKFHPWPTPSGLRALIFRAHTNGFSACIRRVGRRILIDESAFRAWVEGQNRGAAR